MSILRRCAILRGMERVSARTVAVGLAAALVVGAALFTGYAAYAVATLVFAVAMAFGVWNWRLSMLALLAYFPFSGIPSFILYPATEPAVLAKDFLFVIPAYTGFLASFIAQGRRITFPGAPLALVAILCALVVAQTFNPAVPNLLTALVGVKVWLMYIPMMFLGYHLIRSKRDLKMILKVISLTAVVAALFGIAQALLLYGGHDGLAYALYGDAARTATQNFAEHDVGGATLLRAPSTFTFIAQYLSFTATMLALAYAWWRLQDSSSRWKPVAAALVPLMAVAALLSGARGAFVIIPLVLGVILVLDGWVAWRSGILLATGLVGFAAILVAVGVGVLPIVDDLLDHIAQQFDFMIVDGFRTASDLTVVGLGTGVDTNAARHVVDASETFDVVGGQWLESFWVKAWVELGVAGLMVVVALFTVILLRAGRVHLELRDRQLRAVSAAFIAVLAWAILYNLKAQYIDMDPLNVYLWLVVGMQMKLAALDRAPFPAN